MLETETKVWLVGGTVVITIPSDVVNDSAFPFKINIDQKSKSLEPIPVNIKIDGKKLIIEKTK